MENRQVARKSKLKRSCKQWLRGGGMRPVAAAALLLVVLIFMPDARIDSNIRELEGALTKVRGYAMANKVEINLDVVKVALADDRVSTVRSNQPSIQMIIDAVTVYYDIKLSDLMSKRRHKSIALPRQVCMWLARKHTRYSLEEIGGYFGGRDHTTVLHAVRTIGTRRDEDPDISKAVDRIESSIIRHSPVG